jgi:uncharacterized protein (TIGR02594 family)
MAEPSWMQEARRLEGLHEIIGSKHEARVVEFFAEAGHDWVKDDETAWCMAFVNAMLARAGWKGTGKLNARSALAEPSFIVVDEDDVQVGDIVVLERGNSAWQGHVTFYVDGTAKSLRGLGGNQSNAVSVATFQRSRVIGYRRPSVRLDTKAPERAANDLLRVGMMNSERVYSMQVLLKRLGYPVGTPDKDYGNITRDAVLAWKADQGLPLSPDVSMSDLEKMERSSPRPLSDKRIEATAAEVKAVDSSVKHDDSALKTAVAVGSVVAAPTVADETGLLGSLKTASEATAKVNGVVEQAVGTAGKLGVDVAAFLSSHSTLLLLGGLILIGYFVFKSMKARVNDHREGRTL